MSDIDRALVITVARRLDKMASSLEQQGAIASWWPKTLREQSRELRKAAELSEQSQGVEQ